MPLAPHPHILIEVGADGRANIYSVRVIRSGVAISEACSLLRQVEQGLTARLLFGNELGIGGDDGFGFAAPRTPAASNGHALLDDEALSIGGYTFPIARSDPRIYAVMLLRYAREGSELQREYGVKPADAKDVVTRAFKGVRGLAIAKSGIKDDERYASLNRLIRPDESAPDAYWMFKVRANADFAFQLDDKTGTLQVERVSLPVPGTRDIGAMVLLADPRRTLRKDWEKKHGTQLESAKRLAQQMRAAMKQSEPEHVAD